MHSWGSWPDELFSQVGEAADFIGQYCRKYGRISVTQTKEKYGCYDDKTEVLTNNGWKPFKDTDIKTDLFATLDKDGYLIYQKATKYHEQDSHKQLYTVKSRGVDLAVTLDHKLYIAKGSTSGGENNKHRKTYPYELQTYRELFLKPKKFLKSFKWSGKNKKYFTLPKYQNTWNNVENSTRVFVAEEIQLPIKPWLMFLGWFVAEGYVSKKQQVTLCLNGTIEEEKDFVEKILRQLPFEYNIKKRDSSYTITIYSTQLGTWLLNNCGHLAENKKVPDFIKELSSELIEEFLINLYMGDGQKTATANILSTVSQQLEQDVSILLMKAGYTFRTVIRNRMEIKPLIEDREVNSNFPEICINWLKKSNEFELYNSHDLERKKEEIIDYNGKVYCVSIPNQLLLVRQNGKPVWCGNTARVYCGFGIGSFHDITHPGYAYGRYPKFFWRLNISFSYSKVGRFLFGLLNRVAVPYQQFIYRRAYELAFKKWPLIRQEIISGADWPEVVSQYWESIRLCDKHSERSTGSIRMGKACLMCETVKDKNETQD